MKVAERITGIGEKFNLPHVTRLASPLVMLVSSFPALENIALSRQVIWLQNPDGTFISPIHTLLWSVFEKLGQLGMPPDMLAYSVVTALSVLILGDTLISREAEETGEVFRFLRFIAYGGVTLLNLLNVVGVIPHGVG